MNPDNVFKKILSLNDTGETGGHMGGILIPKSNIAFFPTLDADTKNPRANLFMKDRNGRSWKLAYIYYNSALYDGTRNEYRLTGLTEFIASNGLVGGDILKIIKEPDGSYQIDFEKRDQLQSTIPDRPIQLGLEFDQAEGAHHTHSLRPAARLIHTIGENLIKDAEAAIIELVKNGYDADANNVYVKFRFFTNNQQKPELRIIVEDDGHGMTYDQVVNAWLVPATPDKLSRRTSPAGRILQGNKGIGRFAAFRLGSEVFLQTQSKTSPLETTLLLQASDFRNVEFLDQVPVIVDTRNSPLGKPGSLFEMTSYGGDDSFREWKKEDFNKLRAELRKMLFPFRSRDDDFQVWLNYEGFTDLGQADGSEEIEPLPIFDFFDYRIKAQVTSEGVVSGIFNSPLVPGKPEEALALRIPDLNGASCGTIQIDIRVVDREPASLQSLLDRSRAAEDSLFNIGKAQLRRLLNEACGISIFRGDFRIRPYGDVGNDWLQLDSKRVNNPTQCIGNNQTFGTVVIEGESISHLEEKSARDGLREDDHYDRLCQIISKIVEELQRRRYEIRRTIGRIEKSTPVAVMLSKLTDYEKPFGRISKLLTTEGISPEKIAQVREILKLDSEDRQETVSKLEQTIAIYQGQATLGKMVGVLLHEGNRSLGILRNQGSRMPTWLKRLLPNPTEAAVSEVTEGLSGISSAADSLVELFDSIQPLGVRSRGAAKAVALMKPINTVKLAFGSKLSELGIDFEIDVPADFEVIAWEQDLNSILLNLVENSIYWLQNTSIALPRIHIYLDQEGGRSSLNITDNGPGIPVEHIVSEAIFEPTFSLKGGWGLGLPIAGECASRNKFELRAIHSTTGAHFVLDFSPDQNH